MNTNLIEPLEHRTLLSGQFDPDLDLLGTGREDRRPQVFAPLAATALTDMVGRWTGSFQSDGERFRAVLKIKTQDEEGNFRGTVLSDEPDEYVSIRGTIDKKRNVTFRYTGYDDVGSFSGKGSGEVKRTGLVFSGTFRQWEGNDRVEGEFAFRRS